MPDPARIAQAQALEVPVIIQGAKTDPATGQRELFTEETKTILVFDDGALLHLQAKLTVGQAIFIHNLQNKKEVLTKVIEAPAEGQLGHTHLEFTSSVPDFWSTGEAKPPIEERPPEPVPTFLPHAEAPAPEQKHESHDENPLAMMSSTADTIALTHVPSEREERSTALREILVPAYEMVPAPSVAPPVGEPASAPAVEAQALPAVEAPSAPASGPTPEQIDAALKQLSSLPPVTPEEAADQPPNVPEPDHAQTEANLAALMARDARLAKYAAAKDKAAKEIGRVKDSKDSHEPVKDATPAGSETGEPIAVAKPPLWQTLTTGRNAKIMQMAMSVVIVAALGVIGYEEWKIFFPEGRRPVAATAPTRPGITPSSKSALPPATPTAAASTATASAATPQPNAPKPPQPAVVPASATPAAKVVPAPADSAAAKAAEAPPSGPHVVDVAPAEAPAPAPEAAPAETRSRKASSESTGEMIPAKILQQPQPALPDWAKSLDVDSVVKLDAVIDEKGNVTVEKVLSGPRALQHVAETAVQLWQFEPAQQNGKPVASHMTLTVEFQSPPKQQ